ncbi:MAG: hypothetical protein LWY06_02475 [Firmicutes bacterium]|nr:hypothetical protein [Bacillota bacterium]
MKNRGFVTTTAAAVILLVAVFIAPAFAQQGGKPAIIQKLEAKMGKPLTQQQGEKIVQGVQEMTLALKSSQDKLLKEMTSITGLSRDKVLALLPRGAQSAQDKNFLEKLEGAMGRPLKEDEKEKVGKAFYEFIMSAKGASEKFLTRLSEATGLSESVVKEVITGQ